MTIGEQPMKIEWILQRFDRTDASDPATPLASHRYRAILPADGLRQLGHEVRLVWLDEWIGQAEPGDTQVVVLGKYVPTGERTADQLRMRRILDQARRWIDQGVLLVGDFNDDHFDDALTGPYWRELAGLVSVRVAGSSAMVERLRQVCGQDARVVGDPVASPAGEVRVRRLASDATSSGLSRLWRRMPSTPDRMRLLWYGHPTNWSTLTPWFPALRAVSHRQPLSLWVVTQAIGGIETKLASLTAEEPARLTAELVPWDLDAQWRLLHDCDVVLIPSDPSDPRKAVKTANRLTDAVHAGRAVIASELPSYRPWADAVTLTDDPEVALLDLLAHPEEAARRLRSGQRQIEQTCSVLAIAQAWLDAFGAPARRPSELAAAASASSMSPSVVNPAQAPVRINLGCGRQILPGFINVDFAQNWSGVLPDLVADVFKPLPFADGVADEVHAYHVLEHMQRWQVEDCLAEWVRVLKPGGLLVLELPCLDKILSLFQSYQQQGKAAPINMTMWGLFGDPGHRDPHMMHHWCYTKHELRQLLLGAGLVGIESQTAQTHQPARDMRMIGRRPA